MSSPFLRFALFLLAAATFDAATLEKLALEDMIARSTTVVRARVQGQAGTIMRKGMIFTRYTVSVVETWKGAAGGPLEVVVPGGRYGALRQTYAGAPRPSEGTEYVLFLWRSPSGLVHILGLSQGILDIKSAGKDLLVSRAASSEVMVNSQGRVVRDEPIQMKLRDLALKVQSATR